jgi:hypothetical protein
LAGDIIVTLDEYYQWFRDAGFEANGEGTLIAEELVNEHGTVIMVTRGSELSAVDRASAIERYKLYLGIGKPPGGGGVH